MKLWIVCAALSLASGVHSADDCSIHNLEEGQRIELKPSDKADDNQYILELGNDVVSIEIAPGGHFDYVGTDQQNIFLQNMLAYHESEASSANIKTLDYSLTLKCKDETKRAITGLQIRLTKDNVFAPELQDSATNTIDHTLPMPFPPIDIALLQKIIIKDVDIYNTGIEVTSDNDYMQVAAEIVKSDTKMKTFSISVTPTSAITEPVSFTLTLTDKPSGEGVKPKSTDITVNILKNPELSLLAFEKNNYNAIYEVDNPLAFKTTAVLSKEVTVSVAGEDAEECFKADNNKGTVTITGQECTKLYGKAVVQLTLEAEEDGTKATAGLTLNVISKHFEKYVYIEEYREEFALDIKLLDATSADVDVTSSPNELLCKITNNCDMKECQIKCSLADGFDKPFEVYTVQAAKKDTPGSEVTTTVIVYSTPDIPIVEFTEKYYLGTIDHLGIIALPIDIQTIDACTNMDLKLSDENFAYECVGDTIKITVKDPFTPSTDKIKIVTLTAIEDKKEGHAIIVLEVLEEPEMHFKETTYEGKVSKDLELTELKPELINVPTGEVPNLTIDKYTSDFEFIWKGGQIEAKVTRIIPFPVELNVAVFTLTATSTNGVSKTTIILNIEREDAPEPEPIEFTRLIYTGKLQPTPNNEITLDKGPIAIKSDHLDVTVDVDPTDPNKPNFNVEENDKEFKLVAVEGVDFTKLKMVSVVLYATTTDGSSVGYAVVSLEVEQDPVEDVVIGFKDYQIAHTKTAAEADNWEVITMIATSTDTEDEFSYSITVKTPGVTQVEIGKTDGKVKVKKGLPVGTHECVITATGSHSGIIEETPLVLVIQEDDDVIRFEEYQVAHSKKAAEAENWEVITMIATSTDTEDEFSYSITVKTPGVTQVEIGKTDGKVKVKKGIPVGTHECVITATGSHSGIIVETPLVLVIQEDDDVIRFEEYQVAHSKKAAEAENWEVITMVAISTDRDDEISYSITVKTPGVTQVAIGKTDGKVEVKKGIPVGTHECVITATGSHSGIIVKTPLVLVIQEDDDVIRFEEYQVAHSKKAAEAENWEVITMIATSTDTDDEISYSLIVKTPGETQVEIGKTDGKVVVKAGIAIGTHQCVITATGSRSSKRVETPLVLIIVGDEKSPIEYSELIYTGTLESSDNKITLKNGPIKITSGQTDITVLIDSNDPNEPKFTVKGVVKDKEFELIAESGVDFSDLKTIAVSLHASAGESNGYAVVSLEIMQKPIGDKDSITFVPYQVAHTKTAAEADDWEVITMVATSTDRDDEISYSLIVKTQDVIQVEIGKTDGKVVVKKGIPVGTHECVITATGSHSEIIEETPLVLVILGDGEEEVDVIRFKAYQVAHSKKAAETDNWEVITMIATSTDPDDEISYSLTVKTPDVTQVEIGKTNGKVVVKKGIPVGTHECIITATGSHSEIIEETPLVLVIQEDDDVIKFEQYQVAHTKKAGEVVDWEVITMIATSSDTEDKISYSLTVKTPDVNQVEIGKNDGKVVVKTGIPIGTHQCVITATGSHSSKEVETPLVLIIIGDEMSPIEYSELIYTGTLEASNNKITLKNGPIKITSGQTDITVLIDSNDPNEPKFTLKGVVKDKEFELIAESGVDFSDLKTIAVSLHASAGDSNGYAVVSLEIIQTPIGDKDSITFVPYQVAHTKKAAEAENWEVITMVATSTDTDDEISYSLIVKTPHVTQVEIGLTDGKVVVKKGIPVGTHECVVTATGSHSEIIEETPLVLVIQEDDNVIRFKEYQVAHSKKASETDNWEVITMTATSTDTEDKIIYSLTVKTPDVNRVEIGATDGKVIVKKGIPIGTHQCVITATGSHSSMEVETPLVLIIVGDEKSPIEYSELIYTGTLESSDNKITLKNGPIKITSGQTDITVLIDSNDPNKPKFTVKGVVKDKEFELIAESGVDFSGLKTIAVSLHASAGDSNGYAVVSLEIIQKPIGDKDSITFGQYQVAHTKTAAEADDWEVITMVATSTDRDDEISYSLIVKTQDITQVEIGKTDGKVVVKKGIPVGTHECVITAKGSHSGIIEETPLVLVILGDGEEEVDVIKFEQYQVAHTKKAAEAENWEVITMTATSTDTEDKIRYSLTVKTPDVTQVEIGLTDGKVVVKTRIPIGTHQCVITATGSHSRVEVETPLVLVIVGDEKNPIEFSKLTYTGKLHARDNKITLDNGPIKITSDHKDIAISIDSNNPNAFRIQGAVEDKEFELIAEPGVDFSGLKIIAVSLHASSGDSNGYAVVSLEVVQDNYAITFNPYKVAYTEIANNVNDWEVTQLVATSTHPNDKIVYTLKEVPELITQIEIHPDNGIVLVKSGIPVGTHECVITATGSQSKIATDTPLVLVILRKYDPPIPGMPEADFSHVIVELEENHEEEQFVLRKPEHLDGKYGYCVEKYVPDIPDIFYSVAGDVKAKRFLREADEFEDMLLPQFIVTVQLMKVGAIILPGGKCPPDNERHKRDLDLIEGIAMENWNTYTTPEKTIITVLITDVNNNAPEIVNSLVVSYPNKDLIAHIHPPYLTKLHATDRDAVESGFGQITYVSLSPDQLVVNADGGEVYPTSAMYADQEHEYQLQACDQGTPAKCTSVTVHVNLLSSTQVAIMVVERKIEQLDQFLKDLSKNGVTVGALSVNGYYENVAAKMANPFKRADLQTEPQRKVTLVIYVLDANNMPMTTGSIKELFANTAEVTISDVTIAGGSSDEDSSSSNTGYIVAVSVLAVLLAGVLIAGAFLYRRLRNSSSPYKAALLNDSTSLSSVKSLEEEKTATADLDVSVPSAPAHIEESDIQKIEFVKHRGSNASQTKKLERRATGYPLNPPSVDDILEVMEDVDAKSEHSTLPPYQSYFAKKDDDLESVMTDATADTNKSVTFNKEIVHSVLFEDPHDSEDDI